jgi:predicted NBD/HSP70 family sugar kinase
MANDASGFPLPAPRCVPELDPGFRPAALATRAFAHQVRAAGPPQVVRFALEQADGSVHRYQTEIFPGAAQRDETNFRHLERVVKFLLWARGGWRVYFDGPANLGARLAAHYQNETIGRFDSETVGQRMFDHPLEIVTGPELPPGRATSRPLGRHLEGCRIGFDLGGSDRKAAAVIDGKVVFSEEVEWNPYFQTDPKYHYDGIMDSLRKAVAHLPRLDAIGGSAAGVYVNNRVKVASLFRGVPPEVFRARVRDLFLEIQKEWNVPLEVVNDGEVTALAASMSLGVNSVLGISLGTSTAAGWVNAEGNITTWINELAFAPVDYRLEAPRDEWSGDLGCGVQYFSQQCVGRLLAPAGIAAPAGMPLPEQLKLVQSLMREGDGRAEKIYQTIGVYLGYGIAHWADFYDLRHVLILGRVTSGAGGDVILAGARRVLQTEFPELAERIAFHIPDEKDKRHGQAIAAASLPALR